MRLRQAHTTRKTLFVAFVVALGLCASIFYYLAFIPHPTGIRDVTVDGLPAASLPSKLELPEETLSQTFTSPELKADFAFNAIVPMWDGSGSGTIQVRTADASGEWTSWMDIEDDGGALRDNAKAIAEHYPETPLFVEGTRYQYRVKLNRSSTSESSPTFTNLKITYIDSRQSVIEKVSAATKSFFNHKALASNSPAISSRADWGSPDPNGDLFKGTDKYWSPEYRPVKQIFLHHTVSPNIQSDPKALIRAIWDYHANTLGWGDIGYNYIVDYHGNLYQGRYGGDYVVGGHTSGYNYGSAGVAVLGCFEPNDTCKQLDGGKVTGPTSATIDNLSTLLSWKTSVYGINPDITHTFCKADDTGCLSIPTIAAHRQAVSTECNGQLFYNQMDVVRQKTREKNALDLWGVHNINFVKKTNRGSAQQLFYATDNTLYAAFWGGGYSGLSYKTIMSAPLREHFVDGSVLDEPDGTQTLYAATDSAVYKIPLSTDDVFGTPTKLLSQTGIRKIVSDIRDESTRTWRLYVLAQDGPYEYWWREGTGVSAGGLLWNINNGVDLLKSRDPDGKDEIYVAVKSAAYRMKWPVDDGIQRSVVTELSNTVAIDKQTRGDGTELLYTATDTGVHETWWNPSHPAFSDPAKIIQTSSGVIDVQKTAAGNYDQVYVAKPDEVYEFWWGPGSNGVQKTTLIRVSQGGITSINKTTTGSYQNLYTASRSFIYETWWGSGEFGNGPAIVQIK